MIPELLNAASSDGLPAATLTDNGRSYTARLGGGKNAFEYHLAALGITQKTGSAGQPQTQGKVNRPGGRRATRTGTVPVVVAMPTDTKRVASRTP